MTFADRATNQGGSSYAGEMPRSAAVTQKQVMGNPSLLYSVASRQMDPGNRDGAYGINVNNTELNAQMAAGGGQGSSVGLTAALMAATKPVYNVVAGALPLNRGGGVITGPTRCANDPSQLAIGYCPELDVPLCKESFDTLKSQPALKTITLVALHELDAKRRREPETGEPYTMYDLDREKPISTVTKLVGDSKACRVVSIEEAAETVKGDLKTKLNIIKDQLSSTRIASNHVDKLTFAVSQMCLDAKDNINEYFNDFQKKLEQRRRDMLDELNEVSEKKVEILKAMGNRLPQIIEVGGDAADRVGEAIALESDLEILFKKKELEMWLDSVELRVQGLPTLIDEARGALHIIKDDRYDVFLSQCAKLDTKTKDPDMERAWEQIGNLLGSDLGTMLATEGKFSSEKGEFSKRSAAAGSGLAYSVAPSARTGSKQDPRSSATTDIITGRSVSMIGSNAPALQTGETAQFGRSTGGQMSNMKGSAQNVPGGGATSLNAPKGKSAASGLPGGQPSTGSAKYDTALSDLYVKSGLVGLKDVGFERTNISQWDSKQPDPNVWSIQDAAGPSNKEIAFDSGFTEVSVLNLKENGRAVTRKVS